jgi:hypothetical protein
MVQLSGFSSYRLSLVEINLRQRLSVADVIVVNHVFGSTFAKAFAAAADPLVYADKQTKAATMRKLCPKHLRQILRSKQLLSFVH